MDRAYGRALRWIEWVKENTGTELGLVGIGLKEVPHEILQLSSIKHLWLYENQLTELPSEIWQLISLQELCVSDNQLKSLPAEIGQLSNLQQLNLSNNQLTGLPAEIGQLSSLQYLNLSNNQLTGLPVEIEQLSNLQELYLRDNDLGTSYEVLYRQNPQQIIKHILDHQKAKKIEKARRLAEEFEIAKRSKQMQSPPPSVPPI